MSIVLEKDRPRKVCFYGRVSTEHESQISALENQMQWYDNQLEFHPNWILVDKYIDKGITGTQAKKRPSFLRMIQDAKNNKFDLIVTREVCRFARNTVDTLTYTRELKSKYNVEVYFVEDNIWTMDNDGELRLTIMATLAQEESRKISERIKAGQQVSRENGVIYGNGNILGYNRIKCTSEDNEYKPFNSYYVLNDEQAETVRIIYRLCCSGLGERRIANELTRLRRKDANDNVSWTASKVARILNRTTYMGVMTYCQSYNNNFLEQKRITGNKENLIQKRIYRIPVIIPEEEWNETQRIRKERINKLGKGKKPLKNIWSKKLQCSCGSSFKRMRWNRQTAKIPSYGFQCCKQSLYGSKQFRERNGFDTENYCDIKMIAEWKLDIMAKEIFTCIWQDRKQSVIKAYEMIVDCYDDDEANALQRKNIETKISKLKNRIKNLTEMRLDNEISKEEYVSIKSKLSNELNLLDKQKSESYDTKEELTYRLNKIRQALEEIIDFSGKISDDIIDRFIYKVIPIGDDKYNWYINLSNKQSINEDHIIQIELSGRKNNFSINSNVLSSAYDSTYCIATNLGLIIDSEYINEYRKSINPLSRKQTDNLYINLIII